MDKDKRLMVIGSVTLLLIVTVFIFMLKDKVPVESQQSTTTVEAKLEIRGLLYKDPRDEQLTLYERWEEPYYGVPHIVSDTASLDITPFINRIVLMRANSVKQGADDKDQNQITAVSMQEVTELTEKEWAQWIRFMILNDLNRILAQQQARAFIKRYPKSDYLPDTYSYLSQLYLYDAAFQQAVGVLSEFIKNYPENDFFVEKFEQEINRIKQTYLIYPAYGKFILSKGEWQMFSADDLKTHEPTLMQALTEVKTVADKGVDRSILIGLLARSGREDAIKFLLNYQQGAEKTDRLAVARHLQSHIGRDAVKNYYVQLLESDSASLKLQAVQTLGEIDAGAQVVDRLIQTLTDSDDRVVGAVAFALGKIGDARAVEALEELSNSSKPMVSSAADIALKKIRNK